MSDTRDCFKAALGAAPDGVRFVSELSHRCRTSPSSTTTALNELQSAGDVLVVDHAFPDPHLQDVDLRIACLLTSAEGAPDIAGATAAAERLWNKWLTAFLSSHRCS